MAKYVVELKLKLAYIEFKRRAAIVFSLWTLAFIAGISLVILSEFVYNNIEIKIWAVVLAFILFSRVVHDVWKEVKMEYDKKYKNYTDSFDQN